MAWEMREGSGSLFKNDKAKDNPKAPGYRGDIMIDGKVYRLSAWLKEGKNGKFFSLKAEPKDAGYAPPSRPQAPPPDDEFDSQIPF